MPNYDGDGSGNASGGGGYGGYGGDGGNADSNGNDLGYGGGAFSNANIGDTTIGSQYSMYDPANDAYLGEGNSAWSQAGEADWNAQNLTNILRSVEETQNPMDWTGAIKAGVSFLGSLFSGSLLGVALSSAAVGKQVMDYIQRGDDFETAVKNSMTNMGFSQSEVNAAWDSKAKDNPQIGAVGNISVKDGTIQNAGAVADTISGGNANDIANLALETNDGIGGQAGAVPGIGGSTASSIPDQFKNMFVGENPQFNIPQLAQDYVGDVNSAFTDYTQQADDIAGSWQDFENKYSSIGASILDDYDGVRKTYEQNMASIPGLNIKLPTSMGGASIAMAPNQWGDFYSKQAGTSGGLIDSKADSVPNFAQIESTGLSNRQNLNQNMFGNQMDTAQASRYPLDLANQLGSAEQQFKYGVTLNDSGKPDDPEWYESAIPAVAYAASSGGLSDAWDAVSSIFG